MDLRTGTLVLIAPEPDNCFPFIYQNYMRKIGQCLLSCMHVAALQQQCKLKHLNQYFGVTKCSKAMPVLFLYMFLLLYKSWLWLLNNHLFGKNYAYCFCLRVCLRFYFVLSMCFPTTPPGRGLYGPQGHGW